MMRTLVCGAVLLVLYALGLDNVMAALDSMDTALRAAYGRAVPQYAHPNPAARHGR